MLRYASTAHAGPRPPTGGIRLGCRPRRQPSRRRQPQAGPADRTLARTRPPAADRIHRSGSGPASPPRPSRSTRRPMRHPRGRAAPRSIGRRRAAALSHPSAARMAKARRRSARSSARTRPAARHHQHREAELEPGQPAQVDGGEARADESAASRRSPSPRRPAARLRPGAPGGDRGGIAAGREQHDLGRRRAGRLGDVGRVGDQEGVLRRGRELADHARRSGTGPGGTGGRTAICRRRLSGRPAGAGSPGPSPRRRARRRAAPPGRRASRDASPPSK